MPAWAAVLPAILGPMAAPRAPQTGVCGPGAAPVAHPVGRGPSRSRAEWPGEVVPGWCAGPVRLPGPHAAPAAGFPARPAVEWIPNGLARTVSPFAAAKGRRAPSGMDFSVTLSGFRWPALGTEVGITGLAQMPTRSRRGNIDSKSQPHPPLPGSEAPDAAGGNTASDKLMGTRSP